MNEAIRMQLSAFADGELPENEKELLLRRLSQDAEMRRQVAEYLAIGRAIRGEMQVQGIESLRDRIAEEIGTIRTEDDLPAAETGETAEAGKRSYARPLAGVAAAAVVALVAIFGLRQFTPVDPMAIDTTQAADTETAFPTQPAADDILEQYRMLHDAEAADTSMRTRVSAFEIRQDIAEAIEEEANDEDPDSATETPETEEPAAGRTGE